MSGRQLLRLTPKGWTKRRYPTLRSPHPYIGNGPKGGGGCVDCGWAGGHPIHVPRYDA